MERCRIWEYNLREENILVRKISSISLKNYLNSETRSDLLCLDSPPLGLDDSRNTAQLAARMMRDGCVMKITKSLGRVSGCSPMMRVVS